jgi:hypothetical protein
MKHLLIPAWLLITFLLFCAQSEAATNPLLRHYREGETISYSMRGTNQDRHQTLRYEVQAEGVVKKDATGVFFEEYRWSNLRVNQAPITLPAVNTNFRQLVSLDPHFKLSIPDLAGIDPILIAPIVDLLNFYAELSLTMRQPNLVHAGDHASVKNGAPNSWADGRYTLVGEDAIDFDITLKDLDPAAKGVTIIVRHIPPSQPDIKLAAAWMHIAVVPGTPNNWVQVSKHKDGKYTAAVGRETIDVELKVSLDSGRILSATMDNPVEILERECADAALADCGDPVRYQVRRQIEIHGTPDHGPPSASSPTNTGFYGQFSNPGRHRPASNDMRPASVITQTLESFSANYLGRDTFPANLTGGAVHHRHGPAVDAWICAAPSSQVRFTPSRTLLALTRIPSPQASPAGQSPRTPT